MVAYALPHSSIHGMNCHERGHREGFARKSASHCSMNSTFGMKLHAQETCMHKVVDVWCVLSMNGAALSAPGFGADPEEDECGRHGVVMVMA